jgi:hypothetical protein
MIQAMTPSTQVDLLGVTTSRGLEAATPYGHGRRCTISPTVHCHLEGTDHASHGMAVTTSGAYPGQAPHVRPVKRTRQLWS